MTVQTQLHLSDLSLEQLISLNQGFGRQIDAIREQRFVVKKYIEARLAGQADPVPEIPPERVDAVAPGVDLVVNAAGG